MAVTAYGALAGDGSPQWCGLTGGGDGESYAIDGRSLRGACGGWQPPMAGAQMLGRTGGPGYSVAAGKGAPAGDGNPQWCGLTG